MTRYQELKKKGRPNLHGEERAEYQALKPDEDMIDEIDASKPVVGSPTPTEPVVEVKKSVLVELLARVESLEKTNRSLENKSGLYPTGEWKEEEEKKRIHTATLKKFRERSDQPYAYAVDWKFLMKRWDERERIDKLIYAITFRDLDGKEEVKNMDLADFVKMGEREEVTILDKKVKKLVSVTGYVRQRNVKSQGDGYEVEYGGRVPMQVTKTEATYTVKLPSGVVWELPENRLNA